ncbi:unnamed protein product [Paramecium primaurelia]|uniref:Uncharacterized protein n=1 Tax=Paramecium primaurelia TaxID=5886 RepID=A0A8S1MCY1_PARPR|nr:unnamed protein product [Paramecium primaurelia]
MRGNQIKGKYNHQFRKSTKKSIKQNRYTLSLYINYNEGQNQRERDQKIESLSEIIQQQEYQKDIENDNTWKTKFIQINKDYHKLLQKYNQKQAELDALFVSYRRLRDIK